MAPAGLALLVGACCALCAAVPAWLWARAITRSENAERERDGVRDELVQARRTIQSLHKQMGLTETTFIPLSVSRRWMKE